MARPTESVEAFNDRITRRDADALGEMMTEDHVFIDTAGHVIEGKAACVAAWRGFFEAFPDYRNVFERFIERDDEIVVIGRSECSDPWLAGPALWTAKTTGVRVSEWRVWEDSSEIRRMLGLSDGA
jgi:ketosteroid isomerase-like protein